MRVEYVDAKTVKEKLASLKKGKNTISAKDCTFFLMFEHSVFKEARGATQEGEGRRGEGVGSEMTDLKTRNNAKDEREEEDESLKALRETMGFSSFESVKKK